MTNMKEEMKIKKYKSIISSLQRNDKNATYDEILEEENNDLNSAIEVLKESLENVIEEHIDEEIKHFYKEMLERTNNI